MHEHTPIPFPHPPLRTEAPCTAVGRQGAQRLWAQTIEAVEGRTPAYALYTGVGPSDVELHSQIHEIRGHHSKGRVRGRIRGAARAALQRTGHEGRRQPDLACRQ